MYNDNGKLDVFENFRVDVRLPKFQKAIKEARRKKKEVSGEEEADEQKYTKRVTDLESGFEVEKDQFGSFVVMPRIRRSKMRKLLKSIGLWVLDPRPKMSIEKFFSSVKDSVDQVKVVQGRALGYNQALARAKECGQTALYEQLTFGIAAERSETQLLVMGLGKYLSEETLVEFVKRSKRGLQLDYITNFSRLMPNDVTKIKREADDRGIFDNYVVLHYDPKSKNRADTQAEKARRADPILFGLINGRRRLYYVGDWVDDLCDLTLDQIADVMGKDRIEQIMKETEHGAD